jgi:hypothetical protein
MFQSLDNLLLIENTPRASELHKFVREPIGDALRRPSYIRLEQTLLKLTKMSFQGDCHLYNKF